MAPVQEKVLSASITDIQKYRQGIKTATFKIQVYLIRGFS
jgi:hypothetical protein